MTEQSSVDKETLLERTDSDSELLGELIEIFEEDAAGHITSIKDAITGGDYDTLEKSAHSLKGSSYNMSAQRLADLALTLEEAGRNKTVEGMIPVHAQLEVEFQKVMPLLKQIHREM